MNFLNCQNYNDVNETYNDFVQKIVSVIDINVVLKKERGLKQNTQDWFDGKIADEIKIRDKYLIKRKSKLHIDKDFCNVAKCKLQKKLL